MEANLVPTFEIKKLRNRHAFLCISSLFHDLISDETWLNM